MDAFTIFIGLIILTFIIVLAIDYFTKGLKYPLFRHAAYAAVTILGLEFISLVPLNPLLNRTLQDNITLIGLGLAIVSLGYSIMIQLDSDYKQTLFEEKVLSELKEIKEKR